MHARLALVTAFLALPLAAQRTWIVDKNGGAGVDFTDIPPAILAATDGDTINVRGVGPYNEFALTKALVVESLNAAETIRFSIQGVPAGSTARVAGFVVTATTNFLGHVDVSSCAGSVVLSRVQVTHGIATREAIRIQDCASVLVADCVVNAGSSLNPPGAGIVVTRSRAVLQRNQIYGPPGTDGCEIVPGLPGGVGLSCVGSTALVVDGAIMGGKGGRGYDCGHGLYCGADGGAGVAGDAVVVIGTSTIAGGVGGTSAGPSCPPTKQGPAANGACMIASDATVSGALINGAQRIASLAWIKSPGSALLGASVTLTLAGVPGTAILLTVDDRFTITPISGLVTPRLVTTSAAFAGPFTIGAAGTLPLAFQVPPVPVWRGRSVYFQALAFEPVGLTLSLTNVGDLVLR